MQTIEGKLITMSHCTFFIVNYTIPYHNTPPSCHTIPYHTILHPPCQNTPHHTTDTPPPPPSITPPSGGGGGAQTNARRPPAREAAPPRGGGQCSGWNVKVRFRAHVNPVRWALTEPTPPTWHDRRPRVSGGSDGGTHATGWVTRCVRGWLALGIRSALRPLHN